jgi:hypothetical protein
MVSFARKWIALLLLLVMVTNLCVWDSSRNRIAHQLRHVGLVDGNAMTHSHAAVADGGLAKGKLAHVILHAVDHLQFYADTAQADCCLARPTTTVFLPHSEIVPPHGASDPPFRPPSAALAA